LAPDFLVSCFTMDPLPTSPVAAVADTATAGLQLASQVLGYTNTPEEHNAAIAAMNAEHLRALQLAFSTGNLAAAQALLSPTTT
jgi:hypothetical protein